MMARIKRREFSARLSLGTLGTRRDFTKALISGTAAAAWSGVALANHRRAVDLVITALQWSVDDGASWNTAPVPEGAGVWFRATVRNQGRANAPSGRIIRVDFQVNGQVVSWGTRGSGLRAGASATINASTGPMGDHYWHDTVPGTHNVVAVVDPENLHPSEHSGTIDGETNNTRAAILTVEADEPSGPEHTLFTTQVPAVAQDSDPNAVTLGVRWFSDQPGQVVGVRFYKGGMTGGAAHTVALYDSSGALLASAQSAGESATGWQRVNFPTPVPIQADEEYRAAAFWPAGRYPATTNFFAAQFNNPPLHAYGGRNGVYAYGSSLEFPTEIFQSTNYFVDPVVVTEDAPPPQPEPTSLVAVAASASQIDLRWPSTPGAASYRIYENGVRVGTSTTNSHSRTGLNADTRYNYRISAVDASGNEGPLSTAYHERTYGPGTTYYVATNGNDGNSGLSSEQAWRNINNPANGSKNIVPGDTVVVLDGTYVEQVFITEGGSAAGGYVTFRAQNRHGAKIRPSGGYSAINIQANYVAVDGFDVIAVGGHGVDQSQQNQHHFRITNNLCHSCGGSGIGCAYGEFYLIEDNITFGNCRTNEFHTSGISIYQARSTAGDSSTTGFRNIVRSNICFDNMEGSAIQGEHTDGNGIIIDDFRHTQNTAFPAYPHRTLVENNLCYWNGSKGIQVVWSNSVTVRNNTCYWNHRDHANSGTWRGEISNAFSHNNVWANNIAVCSLSNHPGNQALNDTGSSTDVLWYNNLTFNGMVGQNSILTEGTNNPSLTKSAPYFNKFGENPLFVNPGTALGANFRLASGSPAVNASTSGQGVPDEDLDGLPRVVGAAVDMGAYERQG